MAKRILPTVNEKLLERYIRHAVYLEQLKKGEASLISRFLGKKVFPSLSEKLIKELSAIKNLETLGSIRKIPAKRLTRMLLAVRKTAQVGAVKAEKMLVERLINISKFEADWNADIISKTVPLDLDLTMPSNEVLKNLVTMRPMDGHKLGTWMKGYSTAIRVAMTKQIKVGIASGESLPAIGKRINTALKWKGKQAEFIARTAVSNVVHQAKDEVFKKNANIVRKVQWVSTLDDRTSLICINLDGKMFDIGDGPRPPAHFNCRSTIVPITPSWQEFGIDDPPPATRASMNGAVPAKMTYKQWIKKQPKAVQVKVLGKKRAELYRTGRVKIDRFVGRDLKPLNLKQLARREGLDLAPAPRLLTSYGKTTTPDIRSFVDKTVNAYPEKVKNALYKNEIRYNIGNTLTEIDPKLKGLHPAGWSKGATWNNVSGVYDMKKRMVSVAETHLPLGKEVFVANSKDHIRRVLNHETGHAFDGSLGEGLNVYSNQKAFQQAYLKDIAKLSKAEIAKNDLRFFMQKGVRGRSELFADVFADIMGGSGIKNVSKFFPNCKKYVNDILKAKTVPAPPSIIAPKVGMTFVKTTSKEFQDIVTKQIDIYPEKVKIALDKQGITFNAGNKLTEMYPELKGKHPRGWPRGTNWDSVNGMYHRASKSISASETYRPIGKKEFIKAPKNEIKGLLNHETGHGFDWSLSGRYSNTSEFKTAYVKDFGEMTREEMRKRGLQYYHQAGEAGRQETFAEVFADIMGQGAQPGYYGKIGISQYFPNCKKYIEDLLK